MTGRESFPPVEERWSTHHYRIVSSGAFEGFPWWTVFWRSCQSISKGFRSWLWLGHSKVFTLSFSLPIRGGLAGVFWIILLLQNPICFQFQLTNRWPNVHLPDVLVDGGIHGFIYHSKSSRSRSSKTAPGHHTTTPRVLLVVRCYYFYSRCNETHTFKRV